MNITRQGLLNLNNAVLVLKIASEAHGVGQLFQFVADDYKKACYLAWKDYLAEEEKALEATKKLKPVERKFVRLAVERCQHDWLREKYEYLRPYAQTVARERAAAWARYQEESGRAYTRLVDGVLAILQAEEVQA